MDHLDALRATVGAAQVLTGADALPWETDWRDRYRGRSLAVVRPGTTDEVAAVVRLCAQAGLPGRVRAVYLAHAAGADQGNVDSVQE